MSDTESDTMYAEDSLCKANLNFYRQPSFSEGRDIQYLTGI